MQYMLMFGITEAQIAKRNDPATGSAYWAAWRDYLAAMQEAGVVTGGNRLQETAKTFVAREGKWQVQDGPFADTKEQLGGYVILDVGGPDEAVQWALRCPADCCAGLELRPVFPPMQSG